MRRRAPILLAVGLVAALLVAVGVWAAPAPVLLGTGTYAGEAYSLWWVEGWPATPSHECYGPWPVAVEGGRADVRCAMIDQGRERLVIYAWGACRVVAWQDVEIERRPCAYVPVVYGR